MEAPFFLDTKLVLPASDLQASLATDFYRRAFGAQEIDRRYVRAKIPGIAKSVSHLACVMEFPTAERFIVPDVVEDLTVDANSVVKVARKHDRLPAMVTVAAPPYLRPQPVADVPSICALDMIIFQTAEVTRATDIALGLGAYPIRAVAPVSAFGGQGENSVIHDPFGYQWQISTPRNVCYCSQWIYDCLFDCV